MKDEFEETAIQLVEYLSGEEELACILAVTAAALLDSRAYKQDKITPPDSALKDFIHRISLSSPSLRKLFSRGDTFQLMMREGNFHPSAFGMPVGATPKDTPNYPYNVCISYAQSDREIARKVAETLRDEYKYRVFYDEFEEHSLVGKELINHLHNVYANESLYCVILFSQTYADRYWTQHELKAARTRTLMTRGSEYILPFVIGEVELPGDLSSYGYLKVDKGQEASIVEVVFNRVNDWIGENMISLEDITKHINHSWLISCILSRFEESMMESDDESRQDFLALVGLGLAAQRDKLTPSASALMDYIFMGVDSVTRRYDAKRSVSVSSDCSVALSPAQRGSLFVLSKAGWTDYLSEAAEARDAYWMKEMQESEDEAPDDALGD